MVLLIFIETSLGNEEIITPGNGPLIRTLRREFNLNSAIS